MMEYEARGLDAWDIMYKHYLLIRLSHFTLKPHKSSDDYDSILFYQSQIDEFEKMMSESKQRRDSMAVLTPREIDMLR